MADDQVEWKPEEVPPESDTYMRAHREFFRNKILQPGVFRKHGIGMSVDWGKYSTPEQTRQRSRDPLANAVIRLNVGDVRAIKPLDVIHTPVRRDGIENRAHCDLCGIPNERLEQTEMRVALLEIARVVLYFE